MAESIRESNCVADISFILLDNRFPADVQLAHAAIEFHQNESLDNGLRSVTQVLRENNKLRLPEDPPDSPGFVRDRTPLRKGQISTFDLRAEFRRDPALPIFISDMPFTRGIQNGVERGEYVYRYRDLVFGQGDPFTHINDQRR